MRIIVTGGSGFIGKYLITKLIIDHEVFILGQKRDLNWFKPDPDTSIPYCFSDYTSSDLNKLFDKIEPEAVVHLAALRISPHKFSIEEYLQNIIISGNLFEVCFNYGISNIVNTSSLSVYSYRVPIPWTENDPTAPDNYYGLSKVCIEETATLFCHKGLNIKTLRIGQVIGFGERENYVLDIYLKNAINKIPLKVYGSDVGRRHYVYVQDVVRAVELCLIKPELKGIFNIGMQHNYSFYEVASTINKVFQNPAGIIRLPDQKSDEHIYYMSIEKAKEVLKWEPLYDLESSYADMKKHI